MYRLLSLALIALCLLAAGCEQQRKARTDEVEQAAKKVIYRYLEVFNDGNMDLIDATIDSTYIGHHPSYPDNIVGRQEFKEWVEMNRTAFSDFNLSLEEIMAKDNDVFCRWLMTGTHDGPLRDLQPTGKEVRVVGLALSRLEDGKVTEEWIMFDIANLYRQLGYTFVPPES